MPKRKKMTSATATNDSSSNSGSDCSNNEREKSLQKKTSWWPSKIERRRKHSHKHTHRANQPNRFIANSSAFMSHLLLPPSRIWQQNREIESEANRICRQFYQIKSKQGKANLLWFEYMQSNALHTFFYHVHDMARRLMKNFNTMLQQLTPASSTVLNTMNKYRIYNSNNKIPITKSITV